jgi:hypothetical protein
VIPRWTAGGLKLSEIATALSGVAEGSRPILIGARLCVNQQTAMQPPLQQTTSKLLEALRRRGKRIAHELEESKLYEQMVDRGRFREAVIRDFLRPFLPPRYGLSSGEIFSSDGEQSAQIDVVIYDEIFSTILFRDKPDQLFPAESVFGSIEVKSYLSVDELKTACDNIRSVKSLKRSSSDMCDLLPSVRLRLGNGLSADPSVRNPYVGFVWAFDGCSAETASNVMTDMFLRAQNPTDRQLLPDGIIVWKKGYLIVRVEQKQGMNNIGALGRDFTTFAFLKAGKDVLPLFYLMLNTVLGELRLKTIDTESIFFQVFKSYMRGPESVPSLPPR